MGILKHKRTPVGNARLKHGVLVHEVEMQLVEDRLVRHKRNTVARDGDTVMVHEGKYSSYDDTLVV